MSTRMMRRDMVLAAVLMLLVMMFSMVSQVAFAVEDASDALMVGETGVVDSTQPVAAGAEDASDNESATRSKAEAEREAKLARKVIDDGLYRIDSALKSGYAIAVKAASRKGGARVIAASKDSSDWSQAWTAVWDPDTGYYKLRNMNSRMFLGVSGSAKAGAVVKQYKFGKSKSQLWEVVKLSKGVMLQPAGSNLALTASAKKGASTMKLSAAKSSKAQTFNLNPTDLLDADQTYFITSVANDKRIAVAGASRDAGAKMGLAKAKAAKSQKFRLVKAGTAYRLQNVSSCYYVGSKAKSVIQTGERSKATAWNVKVDLNAAAFTIGSKATSKRLDATSGRLRLKVGSESDAQLFTFERTYAFKLYLNPGHGWNSNGNGTIDPGASGNGHTEAEFTHDLAHRVVELLDGTDVEVVNGEKYGLAYWERMPKAVSLGCDAIVSIHFDAGGGTGTLGMVGVQGKAEGSDTLSDIIRSSVVESLGLLDRGPTTRSDITCVNGPIPSMLVEVCFMDNANDVATYLNKRDAVAKGIASGIVRATRNRAVTR